MEPADGGAPYHIVRRGLALPSGGGMSPSGGSPNSMRIVNLAIAGNSVIAACKMLAYANSGSSAMLSEAIHSIVDTANQGLLLYGLHTAKSAPDKTHPYGYGRSVYFWSLVSALSTFWAGAGFSMYAALNNLMDPAIQLHEVSWDVWGILFTSFAVDGVVLSKTVEAFLRTKPRDMPFWTHVMKTRDPTSLAVLLEDAAACVGIVIATTGIGLAQFFKEPVFDAVAGVGVATLLAAVGYQLTVLNERFLLGVSVDPAISGSIRKILEARSSIENVYHVQSQWVGPNTFVFKAEVDFDGTYLAAKLLSHYQREFERLSSLNMAVGDSDDAAERKGREEQWREEMKVVLSFYAEDVMRQLEREVRDIEAAIRVRHPEAVYVELVPYSDDMTKVMIERARQDGTDSSTYRELEARTLDMMLQALSNIKPPGKAAPPAPAPPQTPRMPPAAAVAMPTKDDREAAARVALAANSFETLDASSRRRRKGRRPPSAGDEAAGLGPADAGRDGDGK